VKCQAVPGIPSRALGRPLTRAPPAGSVEFGGPRLAPPDTQVCTRLAMPAHSGPCGCLVKRDRLPPLATVRVHGIGSARCHGALRDHPRVPSRATPPPAQLAQPDSGVAACAGHLCPPGMSPVVGGSPRRHPLERERCVEVGAADGLGLGGGARLLPPRALSATDCTATTRRRWAHGHSVCVRRSDARSGSNAPCARALTHPDLIGALFTPLTPHTR
jgi:hypothetical protein